ncbi:MAG TPA: hypothetical protein VJ739_15970 [Gemmataceae bacterium]|nr:hypothetical protein [Gemmataceae bacterium]
MAMGEKRRVAGFKALVASDRNGSYLMEDADGEYRSWQELSPDGRLRQIASSAAYYDVPFEPFAEAVREALGELPPAAREQVALRLALQGERELRALEKLLPDDGRLEPPPPLVERFQEMLREASARGGPRREADQGIDR